MVNLYLRGRIAERKVVNDLREKGFENIRRSAGSRGPADIYAVRNGRKYYIQVKSGSANASLDEIERLQNLAKQRKGNAILIKRHNRRHKWKFLGSWDL